MERALARDDGTTLAYGFHGAAAAPRTMLLIHGLASNMTRWSEFVHGTTLIQSGWALVTPDLRGHGRSQYRGRLDFDAWCRDLAATLDAEGRRHTVIAGHSMGALVAAHFALRYLERVEGLVLVEPSFAEAMTGTVAMLRSLRGFIRLAALLVRALNSAGIRRRSLPYRDLHRLDVEVARPLLRQRRIAEMVSRYSSFWHDLKYIPVANYLQDVYLQLEPAPDLTPVDAPALTLLSAGSTFTAQSATERVLARMKRNRTVVIQATHWTLTEQPTETRLAIEQWCAGLPRSNP